MSPAVATFGEIMLRISPELKGERLTQANYFRIEPGGSESNVAIALSSLGVRSKFITALPQNSLSEKVIQYLRQFDVGTSEIIRMGDKLGIYWTENGQGPRNSFVIYDRSQSSFSNVQIEDFDWDRILKNCDWFHFSGISPAVSVHVYRLLQNVVANISIPYSIDLNYRSKLWNWLETENSLLSNTMEELCRNATLIAGNESDFQNIFGINPKSSSGDKIFDEIADECFGMFPNLKYVSISIRKSISASSNIWGGNLYVKGSEGYKYEGKKYKLEPIEDRVGTGDSFIAGIIRGIIHKQKYTFQEIVDFSTTLAALNHTTLGDASRFSAEEVTNALKSDGNGRIVR